jgi:hypothetical protein
MTDKGPVPSISLPGRRNLVPGVWSHHRIRFDIDSGIAEYLVDGSSESLAYLTTSGTEAGSVYPAYFGAPADIEIAGNYSGLIDEFRVFRGLVTDESLAERHDLVAPYSSRGGRFVTKPLDTGGPGSILRLLTADVSQPGNSGTAFFVRSGDNPWQWTDTEPRWIPVKSGTSLSGIQGRFFQVSGELYPDGRGVTSPVVSSLVLTYTPDPPPWPPSRLRAESLDGSVRLQWSPSIDFDTAGYVVYYGERPGEYLSPGSPFDAGKTNTCVIEGLQNGRLYYFTVAAYDASGTSRPGPLSAETSARPLAVSGR